MNRKTTIDSIKEQKKMEDSSNAYQDSSDIANMEGNLETIVYYAMAWIFVTFVLFASAKMDLKYSKGYEESGDIEINLEDREDED